MIGYQFDPPYDYGCPPQDPKQRCFREFMEIAVITGLTVEATTVTPGGGGKGGGGKGGGGKGGGGSVGSCMMTSFKAHPFQRVGFRGAYDCKF